MKLLSIKGEVLYKARGLSMRASLEDALQAGVHLNGLDGRRAKLRGAQLDGLVAPGACFWGADFTGADLADADLSDCDMRMATFKETCLVDVMLGGSQCAGAYFCKNLLDGADFSYCTFSCPSVLDEPLHLCRSLNGAVYWHKGEIACDLSAGLTRFNTGVHAVVALGGRLIIDGWLLQAKDMLVSTTTKSSIFPPFFADRHK